MSKKICLNMIVKDETPVITRCLSSLLGFIDRYVIVDTGSKDGTQEMIRSFMSDHGIPGTVYEEEWVSFEHNRNLALQLAYDDADSDYAFFIDADEIFHASDASAIKDAINKHPLDYFLIEKHYGGMRYGLPALINLRSPLIWSWKGVVHEALVPGDDEIHKQCKASTISSCHISARHGEGVRSRGKTLEEKFLADAETLEKALKEDPDDTRHRFYLAQSYRDAKKYDLALENYKIRSQMKGWHEEVYYSYYQVGLILLKQGKYAEGMANMLAACATYRKRSAEPLFALMRHCRANKSFAEACMWGNFALSFLEKPKKDILFVPHDMYEWALLDEYSISLCQSGQYIEGFKYMNDLLHTSNIPGDVRERIFRNITMVLDRIPALPQPEMN